MPYSDMNDREQVSMNLVHVVNVEIRDNHEEATLGSFIIYDLVEKVPIYFLFSFIITLF